MFALIRTDKHRAISAVLHQGWKTLLVDAGFKEVSPGTFQKAHVRIRIHPQFFDASLNVSGMFRGERRTKKGIDSLVKTAIEKATL